VCRHQEQHSHREAALGCINAAGTWQCRLIDELRAWFNLPSDLELRAERVIFNRGVGVEVM
jgi:hypothetical protein